MYHVQHAKGSFHEVSLAELWRKIANCFHKFVLALIKAREEEAARIIAPYLKDHPSTVHKQ